MTTRGSRSSRCALVMSAVAILFLLCAPSAARANGCSVVGTFVFTSAGGRGTVVLSDAGKAEITFIPGHSVSDLGLLPAIGYDGTYETLTLAGACVLMIDLPRRSPARNQVVGLVAFEGRVLMFTGATMPELGQGLALRADTLSGQ